MKLTKTDSLIVAENVINWIQNISDGTPIEMLVDCYQNGREQGFILWAFYGRNKDGVLFSFLGNKAYYICQQRRSDEICVYKGSYTMQSISEDAYKSPKTFSFGEENKAAKWVIDDIKKEYIYELEKLTKK